MSTATEMWERETAKEKMLSSEVSLAEYAIVAEAAVLCVILRDDPNIARLKKLVREREEKFAAYVDQIPRTNEAMKIACVPFAMEESDVH